jgi:hypothetical protein
MPWPTVSEFTDYLKASGMIGLTLTQAQELLDLNGALNAGIEQWEELTHWWPFLSTGNVNETRYFDPPDGKMLDLDGGLLTFTSLYTDLVYEAGGNNSLSTGVSRTNFRDMRLQPPNAQPKGKPWTYIELGFWCGGGTGSVSVTGEWGYCTDANLPSSARLGVMALAAQWLMPQIANLLTNGGLVELERGDERKKWGDAGTMAQSWADQVKTILEMGGYVRKRIA